jgi:hypothetical protein
MGAAVEQALAGFAGKHTGGAGLAEAEVGGGDFADRAPSGGANRRGISDAGVLKNRLPGFFQIGRSQAWFFVFRIG